MNMYSLVGWEVLKAKIEEDELSNEIFNETSLHFNAVISMSLQLFLPSLQ